MRALPIYLYLALLTFPLTPALGEAPGAVDSQSQFERGIEALKAKDGPTASAALETCLELTPKDTPLYLECQWELGWAYWLQNDWAKVVPLWEEVVERDPSRPEGRERLETARANLKVAQMSRQSAASASDSFVSKASNGAQLRLRAVGDLMIGTSFPDGYLPPDDASQTFNDVGAWLQDADLTFGNLEGPICDHGATKKCDPNKPAGRCYAFKSPSRYAALYKAAGFDMMSTANNHAEDFGLECRLETEKHLEAQGIAHSGRPGQIAHLDINGLAVTMVGFHTSPSGHHLNDHRRARALIESLAKECDIMIVSFHGGAEGNKALHVPEGQESFYGENRGDLRTFTHMAIDAGADLILGHGPHVLRGMEVYQDRLIAYSLGNFATYGRFNLSSNLGIGAVLEVSLDNQGRFLGGKLLPTAQEGRGRPMRDTQARAIDLVRMLSSQDFPKSHVRVARDGSLSVPPATANHDG